MDDLAARTRAFVRDVCIPAEARELTAELRAELQAAAREAGVFAPHVPVEYGGHGLDIRGWCDVFEAGGYSTLGPGRPEHRRTRRGQHAPARARRHRRAEGALPRPAGPRRGPLVLRDDRAAPGRRLRSRRARGHRHARRRRLADRRREALHHRRRRRRLRDRHGPRAAGPDDVLRRRRPAGLRRRPPPADHRLGLPRRPLRGLLPRLPRRRRRRARRGGEGVRLRAGPSRARPSDPLHALARAGRPLARHRARPGRRALGLRRQARGPRPRPGPDRRLA